MSAAQENPAAKRQRMVDRIRKLEAGLANNPDTPLDPRVLSAMTDIPRHAFVPSDVSHLAYADAPLDIGHGQTISQPFIVALMSSLARVTPQSRVLEIGTGSGYQTAVLAALAGHVYSLEAVPALAANAGRVLADLGIRNVTAKVGDGRGGWPDHAPFDAIVVTAAPAEVPEALVAQLRGGGRLIIPVGIGRQALTLIEAGDNGRITSRAVLDVRFVPFTGQRP